MKHPKMLSLAAAAAMALMAIGANTAAATVLYGTGHTTLGVGTQIVMSLEEEASANYGSTAEDPIITCTESTLEGEIASAGGAGTRVGIQGKHLTFFGGCNFTIDQTKNGTLSIEHIAGTTNGTVRATGFYTTGHSPFVGACNYGLAANTDLGTLTGSTSGNATMNINAIVTEQAPTRILCPDTTRWIAAYEVTAPANLWVEAS